MKNCHQLYLISVTVILFFAACAHQESGKVAKGLENDPTGQSVPAPKKNRPAKRIQKTSIAQVKAAPVIAPQMESRPLRLQIKTVQIGELPEPVILTTQDRAVASIESRGASKLANTQVADFFLEHYLLSFLAIVVGFISIYYRAIYYKLARRRSRQNQTPQ